MPSRRSNFPPDAAKCPCNTWTGHCCSDSRCRLLRCSAAEPRGFGWAGEAVERLQQVSPKPRKRRKAELKMSAGWATLRTDARAARIASVFEALHSDGGVQRGSHVTPLPGTYPGRATARRAAEGNRPGGRLLDRRHLEDRAANGGQTRGSEGLPARSKPREGRRDSSGDRRDDGSTGHLSRRRPRIRSARLPPPAPSP